jgi:hypothetical protein
VLCIEELSWAKLFWFKREKLWRKDCWSECLDNCEVVLRILMYYLEREREHKACLPLKDSKAQTGPSPLILWCCQFILKPRMTQSKKWRTEADVGCETVWSWNDAEMSEKPWAIRLEPAAHWIRLTAPGIKKRRLHLKSNYTSSRYVWVATCSNLVENLHLF